MARIIEAKAILSAEDRIGKVLDNVGKKFKDLGQGMKTSVEVDRLNRSLDGTRRQLAAIDKINLAQSRISSARLGLAGAETRLAEVSKALAAAQKAKDAGAIADLTTQHRAAQRAVTSGANAIERHSAALREGRRELASFGVPIGNLVAHEHALRQTVERTTEAIRKQTQIEEAGRRLLTPGLGAPPSRREAIRSHAEGLKDRAAQAGKRARLARTDVPDLPLGPLAGVIGAVGAADAYKQAAAFDRRMTMIGQTADASRGEIDALGASVHALAQQTATPVDKLAGGLEALVAQGRNLKESMDFLPSVARTAAATGSAVDDIAKTADSVGSNFKIVGGDMQSAFDIMAAGGKAGQFELKDMARYLPSLGPATAAIGFEGKKGLADLVAMLQVMRKGSGTAEEAVSSMTNILNKMESDKTVKGFKDLGVDLPAAFAKARKEGRNLVEVFEELLQTALKGDKSKLGEIIDDQEFKRGALALMSFKGEWQKLSATLQKSSIGTVGRDLKQVTTDSQAGIDRTSNAVQRFTQSLARAADAAGLSGRLSGMAGELEAVAGALERVNAAYQKGGLKGAGQQVYEDAKATAEAAKARLDAELQRQREAEAQKNVETQNERIKLKEAEIARVQGVAKGGGPNAGTAAARLAMLEKELAVLKQGLGQVEKERDRVNTPPRPQRFGTDPTAPMEGKPGAITPGALSWQQAFPLDLGLVRPPMKGAPLPPQRPTDIPRGIGSIDEVLGPPQRAATALEGAAQRLEQVAAVIANAPTVGEKDAVRAQFDSFDERSRRIPRPRFVEAEMGPRAGGTTRDPKAGGPGFGFGANGIGTLPQGPITAEVKSIPPLSGEVSGKAEVSGNITVTASPWFQAEFNGLKQTVMSLTGRIASIGAAVATNGPGSTGKSAPDAGKGARD